MRAKGGGPKADQEGIPAHAEPILDPRRTDREQTELEQDLRGVPPQKKKKSNRVFLFCFHARVKLLTHPSHEPTWEHSLTPHLHIESRKLRIRRTFSEEPRAGRPQGPVLQRARSRPSENPTVLINPTHNSDILAQSITAALDIQLHFPPNPSRATSCGSCRAVGAQAKASSRSNVVRIDRVPGFFFPGLDRGILVTSIPQCAWTETKTAHPFRALHDGSLREGWEGCGSMHLGQSRNLGNMLSISAHFLRPSMSTGNRTLAQI